MSFKHSSIRAARPDRMKLRQAPTEDTPIPPSWAAPRSRRSSASSASSSGPQQFHEARFPPSEEAALVASSTEIKTEANKHFARADYSQAISTYDRALGECPNYLHYEVAVLQSNIAACHLKLDEWKEAIDSSTRGLDGLEQLLPTPKPSKRKSKKETSGPTTLEESADDTVIELPSDGEDEAAVLETLELDDKRKQDILRIRTKLLLRRARARRQSCLQPPSPPAGQTSGFGSGGTSQWSTLSAALEDYQMLARAPLLPLLPQSDLKTVTHALRELPPAIERAKEKEMAEMMGKLKELGNGILKPFGLSTDMFKMNQDPDTGGYSMNFERGA